MPEELQKHQLLVKLLKMTTSNTDAEALVAIRKANELLTNAGWDWEKLMAGKIKVIGDPFTNLGNPGPAKPQVAEPKPAYQSPKPAYRPAAGPDWNFDNGNAVPPQAAAPPPPKRPGLPIASTLPNKFEGACYCCGTLVAVTGGFIFHPSDYHTRATTSWRVVCTTCNSSRSAVVGPSPAQRQGRGARKVTADDIA